MKIGTHEISNIWILIGSAILIALGIFIFLSIPSCDKSPITPQQTIGEVKAELEKQYTAQIKDKETQIRDYQSRLTVSYNKYTEMANRYIALQKEKENVKPPETNAEIRSRFTALGFAPLSAK